MKMPDHYCELAPFAEAFRNGTPALLYHRLGQAAVLRRNRGLTLPLPLFRRQLAELRAAGFESAAGVDDIGTSNRILLTFDDGDATSLCALEPLQKHSFRAVQFLAAGMIGGVNDWDGTRAPLFDEAQVRDWLAAGNSIGSHTLTHARLTQLAPAEAREEIRASKRSLEDRFGVAVDLFAYPWGEWNEGLAEEVAASGYAAALTTLAGVNTKATPRMALRRETVWCSLRRPRELWLALTS